MEWQKTERSVFRFAFSGHRERGVLFGAVGDGGVMLVERQEAVVQQQFHFAHRVVDEGGLELALPDDDHLPSVLPTAIIIWRL